MGYDHMMAVFNTRFPEGGKVDAITLREVAMALAARANSSTGKCHPSYDDISVHTQVDSRTSLANAIEFLDLIGFMRKENRVLASGGKTSNEYLVRNTRKVRYRNARGDTREADAFIDWHYGPEDEWVPAPDGIHAPPPWWVVWRPRLIEVNYCDPDFAMFCPSDKERWGMDLRRKTPKVRTMGPDGKELEFDDPLAGRSVVFHALDLDVSDLVEPDPKPRRRAVPGNPPLVTPDDHVVIPGDCPSPPTSLPQSPGVTVPVIPNDWVVFWDDYPSHASGLGWSSRMTEINKIESIREPGSESIMRTMKAEREVVREEAAAPCPGDPFYYEKTEEIEERKAKAREKAKSA
jgi:hypothetical protein